jgi:AcrR family transcriptional regulator
MVRAWLVFSQYAGVWCGIMPAPLTPADWLRAAFQNLAAEGAHAIRAEVLAKQLKTTKGSFYWHFKDVPTFKAEMLKLWETEATRAIIAVVTASAPPGADRLRALAALVSAMNADNDYGGVRAEPAIREWARVEPLAAAAMLQVDAARIAYVTTLFVESGFAGTEARLRAELFYSGFLGLQALAAIEPIDIGMRLGALLQLLLSRLPP